jgi:hypothetical protein
MDTRKHGRKRNYVLDGLTTFSRALREKATVSLAYIRQYAAEPLTRALKSLGKSITGIAVEVAKARLREWLMKQGIPWPWTWP